MNKQKETQEREYQQLRGLGLKLHIPIIEAFLELEVRDKDGRVIQRHKQRSRSWVRNAYNCLFSTFAAKDAEDAVYGAGYLNIRKMDDAIMSGPYPKTFIDPGGTADGTSYGYRGPAGDNTRGIIVGSGTNAESFEDYKLQTQIAEGAGAGQLNHVLSEETAVTYTAGTRVWLATLVRYLNNNSGGDVNVNEVGLVTRSLQGGSNIDFVVSRDKLGTTVTIPDTGQLKVTYSIQVTFPG